MAPLWQILAQWALFLTGSLHRPYALHGTGWSPSRPVGRAIMVAVFGWSPAGLQTVSRQSVSSVIGVTLYIQRHRYLFCTWNMKMVSSMVWLTQREGNECPEYTLCCRDRRHLRREWWIALLSNDLALAPGCPYHQFLSAAQQRRLFCSFILLIHAHIHLLLSSSGHHHRRSVTFCTHTTNKEQLADVYPSVTDPLQGCRKCRMYCTVYKKCFDFLTWCCQNYEQPHKISKHNFLKSNRKKNASQHWEDMTDGGNRDKKRNKICNDAE